MYIYLCVSNLIVSAIFRFPRVPRAWSRLALPNSLSPRRSLSLKPGKQTRCENLAKYVKQWYPWELRCWASVRLAYLYKERSSSQRIKF